MMDENPRRFSDLAILGVAGNPNTCSHGYRIETSICPVSECPANADGPRVGDTGPVLACGPLPSGSLSFAATYDPEALAKVYPAEPNHHVRRLRALQAQIEIIDAIPRDLTAILDLTAHYAISVQLSAAYETREPTVADAAEVAALLGLDVAETRFSTDYTHYNWAGSYAGHMVSVCVLIPVLVPIEVEA